MATKSTIDDAFDIGTWVGRRQAFALVAGRCSAADAEILLNIREKKLFRTIEQTWEDFCVKRLGMSRGYVDRIIRQFKSLGPNFFRLNCFTRITPAEYRMIAPAVTHDGLNYGGKVVALEPENAPKLAEAVETLRDAIQEDASTDPVEQVLGKIEKAMITAATQLERLQTMPLTEERQMRLIIAVQLCADQLELFQVAAKV